MTNIQTLTNRNSKGTNTTSNQQTKNPSSVNKDLIKPFKKQESNFLSVKKEYQLNVFRVEALDALKSSEPFKLDFSRLDNYSSR